MFCLGRFKWDEHLPESGDRTMVELNYVAIIVAALANMAIGWLWYSPLLFGKAWIKMVGFSKKDVRKMKKRAGPAMVGGLITSFIVAYILAHFIAVMGASTMELAAQLAFWLWVGFIATVQFGMVLWENKPLKLWLLNASYWLVSMLVMAVILAKW